MLENLVFTSSAASKRVSFGFGEASVVLLSETGVKRNTVFKTEARKGLPKSGSTAVNHGTVQPHKSMTKREISCASVRNWTSCVVRGTKSEYASSRKTGKTSAVARYDRGLTPGLSKVRRISLAAYRTREQAYASPMYKWLGNVDLPSLCPIPMAPRLGRGLQTRVRHVEDDRLSYPPCYLVMPFKTR